MHSPRVFSFEELELSVLSSLISSFSCVDLRNSTNLRYLNVEQMNQVTTNMSFTCFLKSDTSVCCWPPVLDRLKESFFLEPTLDIIY